MSYDERLTEREREAQSAKAADQHYTRLHLAQHDPRVPYRECPECKAVGWR
jgi:hypothetical protein